MSVKNIEIQDSEGNVYHPHTVANVVFTEDGKTVEEKIKNLNQDIIVGKSTIVNSIGNPVLETDTFSQIGTKIDTLTNTFKTNLTNKGVNIINLNKIQELINIIPAIKTGLELAHGESTYSRSTNDGQFSEDVIVINTDITPKIFFVEFNCTMHTSRWGTEYLNGIINGKDSEPAITGLNGVTFRISSLKGKFFLQIENSTGYELDISISIRKWWVFG